MAKTTTTTCPMCRQPLVYDDARDNIRRYRRLLAAAQRARDEAQDVIYLATGGDNDNG